MNSRSAGAWRGRLWLWGAWLAPALPLLVAGGTSAGPAGDALARAAVAAGLAGLLAFAPWGLWRLACALSVLALPYTAWWCGYVAIAGGGPGYEPALAAWHTHWGEAQGAGGLALHRPVFLATLALHGALLVAACRQALRRAAPGGAAATAGASRATGDGRRAWLAFAASILVLVPVAQRASALAVGTPRGARVLPGNAPFTWERVAQPHPLFGAATLASPLGSALEIIGRPGRARAHAAAVGYRRLPAPAATPVAQPATAVWVIGESARADALGERAPRQDPDRAALAARIGRGLGAWLPPACAASDGTHLSVPMLLTATPPERIAEAASAPTLLARLHAAGYATAWLANNQGGPDGTERGHTLYEGVFNVDPDDLYGERLADWRYDTDLLPSLRAFLSAHSPAAVLVHTIGSHFPYQARYPADAFAPEPDGLDADARLQMRYERSIEFTARFLVQAAAELDRRPEPAFLVYTSDHGESLPADANGLLGHLSARTARVVGWVPALVLWNEPFAASGRGSSVLARVRAAPAIAHADVGRVLLGLAGLEAGAVEPTPAPTTWGRRQVGDAYGPVRCDQLDP